MSSVHELVEEASTVGSDCHDGKERGKLVRMDSKFQITPADCNVLHHLLRPAALVAVPDSVSTESEEDEANGEAPNVIIVTDKREALWWHMDTLKTNAPDRCSEDALFDMTVVSNTKEGREVMFKSHIMDQYLIVTQDDSDSGDPQEPQFKFELSSKTDAGITSTFILGTDSQDGDEPNYLYLRFQNAKSNDWYYWYIDSGEVKIRKADATEMFNTRTPPCSD